MTLANRIKQVSSVEFTNISSVRCIPCSPPKVKPPSVAEYPSPSTRLPAPPPLPLVTTELTVSGRPRACPVRPLLSFSHPAYERNHSTHFAEREHLILAPHTDGASPPKEVKGSSHCRDPSRQLRVDSGGGEGSWRSWPLSYRRLLGKGHPAQGKWRTRSRIVPHLLPQIMLQTESYSDNFFTNPKATVAKK